MKKVLFTLATAALIAPAAIAQNWKVDAAHSKIRFSADYLVISDVDGEFTKFDGTITSAKDDFSDIKALITADVNSVNTDNEMRDKHLKSDDFFNSEKFPQIKFESKSVKKIGTNKYIMSGELTIRDVTKKVEVPVVFNGKAKDPWGNLKAGFKATGKINRKEFNLNYNNMTAAGDAVIGDEVEFTIDMVLIKS